MKLLRYGPPGEERPGLLDAAGLLRSLAGVVADIGGAALTPASISRLESLDTAALPIVPGRPRLGPCVAGVGKLVCIGQNYAEHAREMGGAVAQEPVIFMKAVSSICGPDDDIEIPRGATKTDWEVELGVVIGTRAKYVGERSALDHVAGYCLVNDVSERAFQKERGGQWVKGKSHDTFGPLGPWLVTRRDVPDSQRLRLWLDVDGRRMQEGSTAAMIFPVAKLVSYLSQFMTLLPGDVIATGTPSGVAAGMNPAPWLRPGQMVRLGIDGLGEQVHRTVPAG